MDQLRQLRHKKGFKDAVRQETVTSTVPFFLLFSISVFTFVLLFSKLTLQRPNQPHQSDISKVTLPYLLFRDFSFSIYRVTCNCFTF